MINRRQSPVGRRRQAFRFYNLTIFIVHTAGRCGTAGIALPVQFKRSGGQGRILDIFGFRLRNRAGLLGIHANFIPGVGLIPVQGYG